MFSDLKQRYGLLKISLLEKWYGGKVNWEVFEEQSKGPPEIEDAIGPIQEYFWENSGLKIDKWIHYLPLYEQYFWKWRGRSPRFLEIGVQNGGSMAMWRNYFGPSATIFGIDIDPRCAAMDGLNGAVRIGSQDDADFLNSVVEEMGGIDIVLDDGSHFQTHVLTSFRTLFPKLSQGGVYFVEDMHTSYFPRWKGGRARHGTFVEYSKRIVDDMHHWYASFPVSVSEMKNAVSGVHFHDSVVVFDKLEVVKPMRVVTGKDSGIVERSSGAR